MDVPQIECIPCHPWSASHTRCIGVGWKCHAGSGSGRDPGTEFNTARHPRVAGSDAGEGSSSLPEERGPSLTRNQARDLPADQGRGRAVQQPAQAVTGMDDLPLRVELVADLGVGM